MPKFSANLTLMFTETDFLNRFERAYRSGFKGVEFMFPYGWDNRLIAEKLEKFALEMVLHNLPAGNWANGERGLACLPDKIGEFQDSIGLAIECAKALNCTRLNCMSGLTPKDQPPETVRKVLVENLRFAARALEKEHIKLMVEPINNRDIPGIYLTHTQQALELIKEVDHPNIWLQYDIYHMQVMEGNLIHSIRSNITKIGHIQMADNPGRHEPGTGEINFPNLFRAIDEAGYSGWIGCEYQPTGMTEDSLKWYEHYKTKDRNNI
jgi:hydroxypyruvate isomerase